MLVGALFCRYVPGNPKRGSRQSTFGKTKGFAAGHDHALQTDFESKNEVVHAGWHAYAIKRRYIKRVINLGRGISRKVLS